MGSKELEQNQAVLLRLCAEMGLTDHVSELLQTARDEQHLRDTLAGAGGSFRNDSRVFITREWIHNHMKRLRRGGDPIGGLFDEHLN